MKPFNRKVVKVGDLLCLTSNPDRQLRFKFVGQGGVVVATWVDRVEGVPNDAILRQRQVRMVEAA
ncbi:MAG TPA: hypothetical protein VD994_19920 [Prosthecobacter sp.]|nr:hypothetical protein [Prosthecobacter sp.]